MLFLVDLPSWALALEIELERVTFLSKATQVRRIHISVRERGGLLL